MNKLINPKSFFFYYASSDHTAHLVKQYRESSLSNNSDLEDGFMHVLVHSEDWLLLGLSWKLELT